MSSFAWKVMNLSIGKARLQLYIARTWFVTIYSIKDLKMISNLL